MVVAEYASGFFQARAVVRFGVRELALGLKHGTQVVQFDESLPVLLTQHAALLIQRLSVRTLSLGKLALIHKQSTHVPDGDKRVRVLLA